jgi:hypothetical protein
MNDLYLNPYYDLEDDSDFARWLNECPTNCPWCGQEIEEVKTQPQDETASF